MKPKILITPLLTLAILCNAFSQDQYLMVIDLQHKFYEGNKIETRANDMVQSINSIIERFVSK